MLRAGHVRGHRVDRVLRRAGRETAGQRQQHRGRKAAQRGQRGAGHRLVALLEVLHLRVDRREALDRVGDAHREVGEHRRDLVVVRAALGRRAHRDRHHRADDAALDGLAALLQQVAEATGDDGEHDVVDGAAVLGPDGLDVGQAPARPRPAAMRPDRTVERRCRRWPQQRAQARDGAGEVGRLGRRPGRRARRRPQAAHAVVRDLRPRAPAPSRRCAGCPAQAPAPTAAGSRRAAGGARNRRPRSGGPCRRRRRPCSGGSC